MEKNRHIGVEWLLEWQYNGEAWAHLVHLALLAYTLSAYTVYDIIHIYKYIFITILSYSIIGCLFLSCTLEACKSGVHIHRLVRCFAKRFLLLAVYSHIT